MSCRVSNGLGWCVFGEAFDSGVQVIEKLKPGNGVRDPRPLMRDQITVAHPTAPVWLPHAP